MKCSHPICSCSSYAFSYRFFRCEGSDVISGVGEGDPVRRTERTREEKIFENFIFLRLECRVAVRERCL